MTKSEDVTKKAKTIIDKYKTQITAKHKNSIDSEKFSDSGSKHSWHPKTIENKTCEVLDRMDRIFILTLMTFH